MAVSPGEGDRVVADRLKVRQLLAGQVEVPGFERVALAAGAGAPASEVVEAEGRDVAAFPGKERRGMFFDLRPADAEPASLAEPGQFLGRFTEAALERELDSAGILAALAERGYPEVRLVADAADGEHRLRILPASGPEPLVELRASELTCVVQEPVLRAQGVDLLYLLSVHWLSLQNPGQPFRPERPPLPGQKHPGLGFGRRFYGRLTTWAHEWGKDALLNFPEYYHNAVFYASMFRFVSPARQGRLEALRRDLSSLHVCETSAAIDEGRVIEEPGGRPFQWQAAEMLSPVTASVTSALESGDYAAAVARGREAVRYRVTGR